jgi:hypothetical protein
MGRLFVAGAALCALTGAIAATHAACGSEGCLSGDDPRCVVPSPCTKLHFDCQDTIAMTDAYVIKANVKVSQGIDALASAGDVVLENDRVRAVIDALDHPHYIAPTGGTLLDISNPDRDDDAINDVFAATGLLPDDAAVYTSLEILQGDGFAAVLVRGHLQGDPDHFVATRYEVRPCEPGIRVRTELVNRAADAAIWAAADAWYWGGRENLPFTPYPGAGFVHPSFGLTDIQNVYRKVPFMAAAGHASVPVAAYATVSCTDRLLEGFQSATVSAVGGARRIVEPRDYVVYERFIAVDRGPAVSAVIDRALEARRQLWSEPYTTVSGRVQIGSGAAAESSGLGLENRASILFSEGTPDSPIEARVPWTQTVPREDGSFVVSLPAQKRYVIEVQAFGRVVTSTSVVVANDPVMLQAIAIPASGRLSVAVDVDGLETETQVLLHPADDATMQAVRGKLLGAFVECAPMLGPPWGGTPACDRAIVQGSASFEVPVGSYHVYATHGPFATIARQTIAIAPASTTSVALHLSSLPLVPEGVLSADFHVHGGASFDSSIEDRTRVLAFLASSMDVLATTDHDLVSNYDRAMTELGAKDRMVLMTGVETTGHVLFKFVPGTDVPKVIGHWNFWPLPYVDNAPHRGAPYDELMEPGQLFDAVRKAGMPESGVIELNHPLSERELGRDLGWAKAIGVDLTKPLPAYDDGSAQALFLRTPVGATFSNGAYDAEEVMNGTANDHFLPFRALWFYLLDQGIVRAGTANSDSHGLTDDVMGTPRNLVWTEVTKDRFDAAAFNAAVKKGTMIGTNGPVILLSTTASDGTRRAPSVEPFAPAADAKLHLQISAAPWVPVDEVRVIVNHEVKKTIAMDLVRPADPFGRGDLVRYDGEIDLQPLLPSDGSDAWLIVEAGHPLLVTADLNCDGVPDTGDNNGDGVIDWRDVDRNGDGVVDMTDVAQIGGPPSMCDRDQDVGPLPSVKLPTDHDDPLYHFMSVTPGGYPIAFTNPLIMDRDGGGFAPRR